MQIIILGRVARDCPDKVAPLYTIVRHALARVINIAVLNSQGTYGTSLIKCRCCLTVFQSYIKAPPYLGNREGRFFRIFNIVTAQVRCVGDYAYIYLGAGSQPRWNIIQYFQYCTLASDLYRRLGIHISNYRP